MAIPSSVTVIGDYAFAKCPNLANVTIPEGVTTIGRGAFKKCGELKSVKIPSSVKTIDQIAFGDSPCEESVRKQFPGYRSYDE